MEYVRLAGVDVEVSRFGFGGCPLGGHGWGEIDERRLVAAIDQAFDSGVTLFDTADIYGLGKSESLLGEVLRTRRDQVVYATKFGVRRMGDSTVYDNSPVWIREAAEGSLRRLQTDRIDLYQLHYWDRSTPLGDIVTTLQDLVCEGKIRSFGITNLDPSAISDRPVAGLVSFSMEYNLLRQEATPTIWAAKSTGLTFLSWGSLAQGALSGKYRPDMVFDPNDRRSRDAYTAFHGEGLERRERVVSLLRAMTARYPGRSVAQLAIRWILDSHPASVALIGMKSPEQVLSTVGAFGWSLTDDDRAMLSKAGAESASPANGIPAD